MSRHSAADIEAEVRGASREVALHRAAIVGVVTAALAVATAQHWITFGLSSEILRYADEVLTFMAAVGAGVAIRPVTTPADQSLQPRNSAGQNLVPDPSAADALTADDSAGDAASALDDAAGPDGQGLP